MSQGTNFVDYVKISCKSGKGGPGSAYLHRDKKTSMGGPLVATAPEADMLL